MFAVGCVMQYSICSALYENGKGKPKRGERQECRKYSYAGENLTYAETSLGCAGMILPHAGIVSARAGVVMGCGKLLSAYAGKIPAHAGLVLP